MSHYMLNFIVYTTAMIGVIFVALFAFKYATGTNFNRKNSSLSVVDALKLSARKNLYVIKAENERFLIAADIDKTTLIAKLGEKQAQTFRDDKSLNLNSFDGIEAIDDFSTVVDFKEHSKKGPVMKKLAQKLRG